FDSDRVDRGLHAWEAPDILPFGSFLERLWEGALYSDAAPELPLLLAAAQEQALWEDIVASSAWGGLLLSPARTANQCRDAWRLAHAWGIEGVLDKFSGNDDAPAFAEWAGEYVKRTQGRIDSARLADAVSKIAALPAVAKPRALVAYAFDILPPQ